MSQPFDADAVAEAYLKCRRAKSAMSKVFEQNCNVLDAEMERLGGLMMDFLNANGMDSAKCKHGTFYKTPKVRPQVADWTAFYKWIREHDAFEFLHKRVSSEAVKTYMDDHKDDAQGLPPGVTVLKEYEVTVRTGKEK